jgi:hypothetical protein
MRAFRQVWAAGESVRVLMLVALQPGGAETHVRLLA